MTLCGCTTYDPSQLTSKTVQFFECGTTFSITFENLVPDFCDCNPCVINKSYVFDGSSQTVMLYKVLTAEEALALNGVNGLNLLNIIWATYSVGGTSYNPNKRYKVLRRDGTLAINTVDYTLLNCFLTFLSPSNVWVAGDTLVLYI